MVGYLLIIPAINGGAPSLFRHGLLISPPNRCEAGNYEGMISCLQQSPGQGSVLHFSDEQTFIPCMPCVQHRHLCAWRRPEIIIQEHLVIREVVSLAANADISFTWTTCRDPDNIVLQLSG